MHGSEAHRIDSHEGANEQHDFWQAKGPVLEVAETYRGEESAYTSRTLDEVATWRDRCESRPFEGGSMRDEVETELYPPSSGRRPASGSWNADGTTPESDFAGEKNGRHPAYTCRHD